MTKFTNSLNDREYSVLSLDDKILYLNEKNYGDFRKLSYDEIQLYTPILMQHAKNETFTPYAIRESTHELVVKHNTLGMYGKLSPRLFVKI